MVDELFDECTDYFDKDCTVFLLMQAFAKGFFGIYGDPVLNRCIMNWSSGQTIFIRKLSENKIEYKYAGVVGWLHQKSFLLYICMAFS